MMERFDDIGAFEICPNVSNIGASELDLSSALVASYIADIPIDPYSSCNQADTCYDVCLTLAKRITVLAPRVETRNSLSVTR